MPYAHDSLLRPRRRDVDPLAKTRAETLKQDSATRYPLSRFILHGQTVSNMPVSQSVLSHHDAYGYTPAQHHDFEKIIYGQMLQRDRQSAIEEQVTALIDLAERFVSPGDLEKQGTLLGDLVERLSAMETQLQRQSTLHAETLRSAISTQSKDMIARRDYALFGGGARVIKTLTTDTHLKPPESILGSISGWWKGYNDAWRHIKPTSVILEPDISVGECWSLSGSSGHVGIYLQERIVVTNITIDHAPPDLLSTQQQQSAPRSIKIWALLDPSYVEEMVADAGSGSLCWHIGELEFCRSTHFLTDTPSKPYHKNDVFVALTRFTYQKDAPSHVQTFAVPDELLVPKFATQIVVVELLTNWGSDTTCLYRKKRGACLCEGEDTKKEKVGGAAGKGLEASYGDVVGSVNVAEKEVNEFWVLGLRLTRGQAQTFWPAADVREVVITGLRGGAARWTCSQTRPRNDDGMSARERVSMTMKRLDGKPGFGTAMSVQQGEALRTTGATRFARSSAASFLAIPGWTGVQRNRPIWLEKLGQKVGGEDQADEFGVVDCVFVEPSMWKRSEATSKSPRQRMVASRALYRARAVDAESWPVLSWQVFDRWKMEWQSAVIASVDRAVRGHGAERRGYQVHGRARGRYRLGREGGDKSNAAIGPVEGQRRRMDSNYAQAGTRKIQT
ncbi:hypothetical protein CONPUDRAFT_70697 [Coniophora puteana RWD-64-598 SS2]|uniref:SUN domain-containing protein n=1 Tax=Coniophora puteana (strain RWD-64-598) TaxID=741705 RepID=A0A5M3MX66_CONPW|nr:uncharacterized protein CONPUDRAFT_70697 [Coniophora puteana RWD-64-598 SS2]EIW83739.1 hypothetical protein CONPUDRAFT_70697 [Coniophora puteana RWD-64-598 SS2]